MRPHLTSVIVPVKNREDTLAATLRSLAAQTSRDFEVIIIDDGSDDNGIKIARSFEGDLPACRIIRRAEERPDRSGAQVCRNVGINRADGEYVLFLDSDDLLAPHCIEQRARYLRANAGLAFAVWQGTNFEGAPRAGDALWSSWAPDQDDLFLFVSGRIPWQTSGPLWRRAALEHVGGWDEDLVNAGHDYEFHVRALAAGLPYARVANIDYHWRKPRADSLSAFESFKVHHRDGTLIATYDRILHAVARTEKFTPEYKRAAWRQTMRLASQCLLFGGSRRTARRAIDVARKMGCAGTLEYAEASICIALWFQLGGSLPSLYYISRRGLAHRVGVRP